jgi:hypothetical protein
MSEIKQGKPKIRKIFIINNNSDKEIVVIFSKVLQNIIDFPVQLA